jgi:hypothetical protein
MLSTLFYVVPFLIGFCFCGISGIAAGVFLVTCVTDWIVNRIIVRSHVYAGCLKVVRASAAKRRKDDQASN